MKRFTALLIVFVLAHSIADAQLKTGTLMLGGDLGFSHQSAGIPPGQNDFQGKSSTINFSPAVSVALKDNLFAGVRLYYSHSKSDPDPIPGGSVGGYDNSTYGGGLFLREYKPLGSRFWFFVEENLNVYGEKSKAPTSYNSFTGTLGVYPGVAFGVTHHLQLETGLQNLFNIGYTHYSGGASTNSFNVSTGLSQTFNNLYLGARFVFGN